MVNWQRLEEQQGKNIIVIYEVKEPSKFKWPITYYEILYNSNHFSDTIYRHLSKEHSLDFSLRESQIHYGGLSAPLCMSYHVSLFFELRIFRK